MPAVLVELDFICNPTQERFLNSESGQEKMAKSIYNAFVKYKSDYDRKQNAGKRVEESPSSSAVVSPDKKTQTSDSNVKISEQAEKSGVTYYKVQFMSNIIKTEECINTPMENLPTETKYRNNIKK